MYIDNIIKELSLYLQDKDNISTEDVKELESLINQLHLIMHSHSEIVSLNIDELCKYVSLNNENKNWISIIKIMYESKSNNLKVNDEQNDRLENLINGFLNLLNQKLSEIKENNANHESEIKSIKKIRRTIETTRSINDLSDEEFEMLVKILENSKFSKKDLSKIIMDNMFDRLNNYEDSELLSPTDEEEIIELEVTNLDKNEVEELLLKYGYDFNLYKEKDQKRILKYAELSNMEKILQILNSENIIIPASYYSKFSQILSFSNEEALMDVINIIKKSNNNSVSSEFLAHLDVPSIFIKKKKIKGIMRSEGGKGKQNDNDVGCHEYFMNNCKFFASLGIEDINAAFRNCSTAFIVNDKKIKKTQQMFELYKIPTSSYLNTLSCFISSNPLEIVDLYIELGAKDYIFNSMSVVRIPRSDPRYYRLFKAKEDNVKDENIFRQIKTGDGKVKQILRGSVTDSGYGIDENNTSIAINECSANFEINYDNEINNEVLGGPINFAYEDAYIKMLDEQYMQDEHTYNFDGVLISRFKVIRTYERLIPSTNGNSYDKLRYAILRNGMFNQEKIEKIDNILRLLGKNAPMERKLS